MFLTRVLIEQDRLEESKAAAHEVLAKAPQDARGHYLLGLILNDLGFHSEAEQHYLDCLRIESNLPFVHLSYAELMYLTGHMGKSERLALRALALDPELADAHQLLTNIKIEKGKRREANDESFRSAQLAPEDAWSHYSLGVAAHGSGHPFRARQHFRAALAMEPSNMDFEESFLQADRSCRWIGLPFYFYSRFLDFVPGSNVGVWFFVIGGYSAASALGLGLHPVAVGGLLFYALLCLYT